MLSNERRTKNGLSRKYCSLASAEAVTLQFPFRTLGCCYDRAVHRPCRGNCTVKVAVTIYRAARHKYGLLEKKQDYLKRARHHQKQENVLQVPHAPCQRISSDMSQAARKQSTLVFRAVRVQVLREKAETKNPDEFYQAMQRDHMHGGPSKSK